MPGDNYIAIDWGTTNRRIYLMRADGRIARTARSDRGVLAMAGAAYVDEIAAIREEFGELPIIAAGMVGSSKGWRDVPYCDAPVDLGGLADAVVPCGDRVYLVPGVAQRLPGHANVMRGEEVQALGACSAGFAPADSLFCQPGTHSKWISVTGCRIDDFTTAMTGELYALLSRQSVLSEMIVNEPVAGQPFMDGLARSRADCDLVSAIFNVRSACLLGLMEREDSASYLSGLLIGADVAARKDIAGSEVFLLASGPLAELYGLAIEAMGGRQQTIDSSASFAAGIHVIWENMR
ncbi:MAG: 2-dehydro-3-deoxygalactonokinase [Sphingomonadaceae bacterium]